MKACATCGTTLAPIRDDGDCFRCHVKGIGFSFIGGGGYTRQTFHDYTTAEAARMHRGPDPSQTERATLTHGRN